MFYGIEISENKSHLGLIVMNFFASFSKFFLSRYYLKTPTAVSFFSPSLQLNSYFSTYFQFKRIGQIIIYLP